MSLLSEYHTLLRLTRDYLLQEQREEEMLPLRPLPMMEKKEELLPSPPLVCDAAPIPMIEETSSHLVVPKIEKVEMEEIRKLLHSMNSASFFPQPITPLMIVAPTEKKEELDFLTKIAQALTPLYGETTLIAGKELENNKAIHFLLSSILLKLLILPSSFAKAHPALRKAKSLFIMEDIPTYLDNTAQKRKLWQALKTLKIK